MTHPSTSRTNAQAHSPIPSHTEETSLDRHHLKVLGASMVGTTIEWFDFFIYAQAAGIIFATQFFGPVGTSNPTLAEVASWASLGISFLFRPLGAVIAGHLGDKWGRKPALVLTLSGMGIATMLIGLLPTYATWGSAAAMCLVVLRILQGLSAGGEWGGAAMLAVEHAPQSRRGFFGSFPQIGVPVGMALATIFMLVLSGILSPQDFEAWGWRIPFIASILLIVVGFFVRRTVEESPAFTQMQHLKARESSPLSVLLHKHWRTVVQCAFIFMANNAVGYFVIAYFVTYATTTAGYSRTTALTVTLVGALVWIIATPVFGAISDTFGRRRLFIYGYVATFVWAIPTWLLIDSSNAVLFGIAVVVVATIQGSTYAQQSAMYAEMFPVSVRLSGTSIGYALGTVLGGAFAPMLAAIFLELSGTSLTIAAYSMVLCALSFAAVIQVNPAIQGRDLSE